MVTRRALLGMGAGAIIAVAAGVSVDELLRGSDSVVLPNFPHLRPGPLESGSFYSASRHQTVGWTISYPPGHGPGSALPVCLVLHGFDSNHAYAFTTLQLQVAQAQLIDGKALAPIVLASVDGGNAYWHPRGDGDNPIKMILEEFLPMLSTRGLEVGRVAVLGWSMGGYGALLLAELSPIVKAVAAESPAIWPSYEVAQSVNSTAFDSAEDWQRYDVVAHAAALAAVVRVDCGLSDPFLPASETLEKVLHPPSAVHLSPGGHDGTFWAGRGPEQLRFVTSEMA